jgi:hypothetical protein
MGLRWRDSGVLALLGATVLLAAGAYQRPEATIESVPLAMCRRHRCPVNRP